MSQAQEAPTTTPIGPLARRVVTGLGQDGKAKIIYDDTEGSVITLPNGGRIQNSWWTDSVPADCSTHTNADPTGVRTFRIHNEGSIAAFVWMPPGARAPMHLTNTIDYGVIMEGELEMELDSGEKTILRSGDIIVQREARHSWHNFSTTQWVKFFSVMIATQNAVSKDGTTA